jgi:hypothetical protein
MLVKFLIHILNILSHTWKINCDPFNFSWRRYWVLIRATVTPNLDKKIVVNSAAQVPWIEVEEDWLTDLLWCEGLVTTQLLLSNLSWTPDFTVKIHLQLACGGILLFMRFDRRKWQHKLLLKISLHNIFYIF